MHWDMDTKDETGGTLDEKARNAQKTLEYYSSLTGLEGEDLETKLSDLLIDLRHLCSKEHIKLAPVISKSLRFYRAERDEIPSTHGL